jgi:DtxR family Mn-dependent transcriptional regulator
LFLVEVMGVDWGAVHDEAEALEHAVSDALVERMDEMLGHPVHDPHGAPIPTADGVLPRLNTHALSACEPGTYRLLRVEEDSSGFLNWLKQHRLLPGARFKVVGLDGFAETVSIQREEGEPIQIGLQAAAKLRVVPDAVRA